MTDKEISNVLDDMVIIWDNREKVNDHVLSYLDDNKIPHIPEKLNSADYSFILPNYSELGLDRKFLVERKGSLDELAGNFTKGRERFEREFQRITDEKIHMVLEGVTFKKLLNGSYRSQFNPKSYLASLITWNIRYDSPIWFCTKEESGQIIYSILKYELLENLKNRC